jgi:hypothetical protein
VFALGYRRLEWKCHGLNQPSRDAAARFGFRFEGLFRQHMVMKGENRDTAWFSIIDEEWPALRAGFEAWLDPPISMRQGGRCGGWRRAADGPGHPRHQNAGCGGRCLCAARL